MHPDIVEEILRALRRINRLVDIHSRRLVSDFGLTGPQLVCLRAIARADGSPPSVLAREVSLSQATVTGIVDRLVARQLVVKERSAKDRRQVAVSVTEAGRALIEAAPYPLQDRFQQALQTLDPEAQDRMLATLRQIVRMMGGEEIDAAPVLSSDPSLVSPGEDPPTEDEDLD